MVTAEVLRGTALPQPDATVIAEYVERWSLTTEPGVVPLDELSGTLAAQGTSWVDLGVGWADVVERRALP